MTEWIAYSTWSHGRQNARVTRAHIIATTVEQDGEKRYRPECRNSSVKFRYMLRPRYLKFVKRVEDLPPRVLPCNDCFKCSDVPYWAAISKKGTPIPKTKMCSPVNGCAKRKRLENFPKHPTKKWGRDSICRECLRERNKYYPRRSDTKSLRVTPTTHTTLKEFAESKGMGLQETAVRLLRLGMESMCMAKGCVQRRHARGLCEDHYRQIVERVA